MWGGAVPTSSFSLRLFRFPPLLHISFSLYTLIPSPLPFYAHSLPSLPSPWGPGPWPRTIFDTLQCRRWIIVYFWWEIWLVDSILHHVSTYRRTFKAHDLPWRSPIQELNVVDMTWLHWTSHRASIGRHRAPFWWEKSHFILWACTVGWNTNICAQSHRLCTFTMKYDFSYTVTICLSVFIKNMNSLKPSLIKQKQISSILICIVWQMYAVAARGGGAGGSICSRAPPERGRR